MSRQLEIPVRVSVPAGRQVARRAEPVTGGVPLPRGVAREDDAWQLLTADGDPLPVQTTPMDRWPDGSLRWLLVDSQVGLRADDSTLPLVLRLERPAGRLETTSRCTVQQTATDVTVDTGPCAFRLSHASPMLIASVTGAGGQIYDGAAAAVRVTGSTGEPWRVTWHNTKVESAGSMRVSTTTAGVATSPDGRDVDLFMRLEFFRGHSVVRLRLTVRNPRKAAHPRGIWELGDAGSLLFKDISLVLPTAVAADTRLHMSAEPGQHVEGTRRVYVSQESSGGENWSSPNHRNRHGDVPMRFRGYEAQVDGGTLSGQRAQPIVTMDGHDSFLGVAIPAFWQNFPRAVEATPAALRVSFFPPEAADLQEIQGGEQKTHECYLCFAPDTVTEVPLDWCRSRAILSATPDWYIQSGAIPNLVAVRDEPPAYRALVDAALAGNDTFAQKRERADEYGWRHFGDIYGDHEGVFMTSGTPVISHFNNQYDPIAGFFAQFLRTGDVRWWQHCIELAAHVADIDVYHTNRDKSGYNHGLFWHTCHYVDAGISTHRSYPRGTAGGGPSAEHNYTTGLMHVYFATGDAIAREAAVGLARFVVDSDDGSKTIFRFLAGGYTGVASSSRSPDYHGPGRGSGNSLNAVVDGHRLTGERLFLDKAEQLIRRCTHPQQDLQRLNLLDAENRWFYTIFLQALAKYLQWKIELDELDGMYSYARDVLLHFARWMADHERPYLDRPELLEFPTETWAAQDVRKSEVFDYAARYAPASDVERFSERAEFFFRYSLDTLTTMPTRTLARPVVLMLVHGLVRAHARKNGLVQAPEPRENWMARWPVYEPFVPQKARAVRRLKQIVVAAIVALVAALAALTTI